MPWPKRYAANLELSRQVNLGTANTQIPWLFPHNFWQRNTALHLSAHTYFGRQAPEFSQSFLAARFVRRDGTLQDKNERAATKFNRYMSSIEVNSSTFAPASSVPLRVFMHEPLSAAHNIEPLCTPNVGPPTAVQNVTLARAITWGCFAAACSAQNSKSLAIDTVLNNQGSKNGAKLTASCSRTRVKHSADETLSSVNRNSRQSISNAANHGRSSRPKSEMKSI